MVDFAREQCPTLDHLYQFASVAQEAGYDALGLYVEHRFASDCAPWAHGVGAITPQMVRALQSEFPSLQIVPFVNLLGHFEGFLYTEEGRAMREELFNGLQACPSCPEFCDLAKLLLAQVLDVFTSEVVHIGGDETAQLNRCPRCQARTESIEGDQKAWLYAEHFRTLVDQVVAAGRTPAVWGDMFLEHPTALDIMPKETVIFDWQYQKGVKDTAAKFPGFRVVGCPTLHVYNAVWMHTQGSEENVRAVAKDVADMGLHGFCLTTWECGLFGAFDTLFPAVDWSAKVADDPALQTGLLASYAEEAEWARLMGEEMEKLGGVFVYNGHRNRIKSRLLLTGNPFSLWLHHREQLSGPDGWAALEICERALRTTTSEAQKCVTLFVRSAIEFVQLAEAAARHYAACEPEACISHLAPTRALFDNLEKIARQNHDRIGGSLADGERCRVAKRHVETVITRVRDYGNRELGYLPAFEVLAHHRFVPHDQACWWLVNKWAND